MRHHRLRSKNQYTAKDREIHRVAIGLMSTVWIKDVLRYVKLQHSRFQ